MEPIEVRYPIYTIDQKELIAPGTMLTEALMAELIARIPGPAPTPRSFIDFETTRQDIQDLFHSPTYAIIFSDPARNRQVMELIEKVELIPPVLASLDYFRVLDIYTYRHILLVMMISALLAQELLDSASEQLIEVMAGPMHDIGKICVPLEILQKDTPLNEKERHYLEHHSVAGYALLAYYLQDPGCLAARAARDHHERCNGTGYPRGIALRDPMVEIIVACDVFDALISERPYRPQSFDTRTALEVLVDMAAQGALSEDVVRALVGFNRKSHPHYADCELSREHRGAPPPENVYGIRSADVTPPEDAD
jgi:HD-GYP domain-containing protein (c-di-GMP phosphodiesterase class II)